MGTKLYVGNLNFTTTEDALRTAFAANGRTVKLIFDSSSEAVVY